MMQRLRRILGLTLALVLVLASQSMAVARGQTMSAGQMVICTGAGIVVVHVDEKGQPTSAPHICPDCALHLLAGLTPYDGLIHAPKRAMPLVLHSVARQVPIAATIRAACARAPPFVI